MVFMLPSEFMVPDSDGDEPELEEVVAQLTLEPVLAAFEKPKDKNASILKLYS